MRLNIFFKVLHWAFRDYSIKIDVVHTDKDMIDTMVITIKDKKEIDK